MRELKVDEEKRNGRGLYPFLYLLLSLLCSDGSLTVTAINTHAKPAIVRAVSNGVIAFG
jgi:hypothetical protein